MVNNSQLNQKKNVNSPSNTTKYNVVSLFTRIAFACGNATRWNPFLHGSLVTSPVRSINRPTDRWVISMHATQSSISVSATIAVQMRRVVMLVVVATVFVVAIVVVADVRIRTGLMMQRRMVCLIRQRSLMMKRGV